MTRDTERALAILFRRFSDEPVGRDDLVKAISLELDWTKPSLAENLLDRGLNAGYIETSEEGLVAAFDPTEVEVPFGFHPGEELFEPVETEDDASAETAQQGSGPLPDAPPGVEELLDRIAEAMDDDRKQAVAATNARQEAMGGLVTFEAAALLVAHGLDLDVQEEAEGVLARLGEEAPAGDDDR